MFSFFSSNRRILHEIREVNYKLADLNQSVADLQVAVAAVAQRVGDISGPLQQQITDLQNTIQQERDAAAALAAAEDAEDVQQNQALADAQAATDAALANAQASADSIENEVANLNAVAVVTPPPVEPGA